MYIDFCQVYPNPSQLWHHIDIVHTLYILVYMNIATETINIRIDKKTKKDADKTLKEMGLDLSSGIKLFLKQVIYSGSIPFQVRTVNGFTSEYEARMIKETEEAVKKGKSYSSAEKMHKAILEEDDDE